MTKDQNIALFNQKKVRRHWDAEKEEWYFSVIDVVAILSENARPRKYWNDLKSKLQKEGSEVSDKIGQLKLTSTDGKKRTTDVANTETILRLIQSIPSPKAEPFKLWLAQVGYERLEETADPEQSIDRAMKTYLQKGYSKNWINQRLQSIKVRKELTDEWQERGMKVGKEFAILSDEITKAWANRTIKDYKKLKGLKTENLRDNMSTLELVLNMLAEASTTEISKKKVPQGLRQNRRVAHEGGTVAKVARTEIERQTGQSVISAENAKALQ
ncbi:MAG: Bro-N domain-containing protein [bacterium]|nr:Bro-N domain-containing protein [bacterium]